MIVLEIMAVVFMVFIIAVISFIIGYAFGISRNNQNRNE